MIILRSGPTGASIILKSPRFAAEPGALDEHGLVSLGRVVIVIMRGATLGSALHSGVGLARSASFHSYCKLTRYRINKVSSSTGSARNQMKRMWLFAQYGIINLGPDDVPGVRA